MTEPTIRFKIKQKTSRKARRIPHAQAFWYFHTLLTKVRGNWLEYPYEEMYS